MQKDPLPAEFVTYIKRLALDPRTRNINHIWRGLILRWGFWLDGVNSNALPGYTTCPKPVERTGLPAGWTYRKFHDIAREAIGTPAIYQARKRAAVAAGTRYDCGSGQDYGICQVCGHGHGFVLMSATVPTSLVTH